MAVQPHADAGHAWERRAWSEAQGMLAHSPCLCILYECKNSHECVAVEDEICRHTDFVTSLDFHPIDDKYFISGSIDGKVGSHRIMPQSPLAQTVHVACKGAAAARSDGCGLIVPAACK
jgi:hypothetical protein